MKKMILLLSLVVVGCVLSLGSPKESESKVSVIRQGDVFHVIYEARQTSVVGLTIYDEEGNKLFSEKIIGDRFARPYNFSQLPKGDYTLQIQDHNISQTQTICHHEKAWVAQIAKVKAPENKFLVAIPRQPDADIMVSIFDQNDQLVYSELARGDQDFAKVYNLKNLAGGFIRVSNKLSGEARILRVD